MTIGDGSGWDETTPTNSTVATSIDDYDRDVRIGVRSRMAFEHEWPASQSATNQAGQHKFVTLQNQGAKPTVSGTQLGAVYTKTVGSGLQELFWENEAGAELQLTSRTSLSVIVVRTGTSNIICSTQTSTIPLDGTPPQLGEGFTACTVSVTPSKTSDQYLVTGQAVLMTSGAGGDPGTVAVFSVGSTANAAAPCFLTANGPQTIPISCLISPNTTGAVSISMNVGGSAKGVVINSATSGGNGYYGTANGTWLSVLGVN